MSGFALRAPRASLHPQRVTSAVTPAELKYGLAALSGGGEVLADRDAFSRFVSRASVSYGRLLFAELERRRWAVRRDGKPHSARPALLRSRCRRRRCLRPREP